MGYLKNHAAVSSPFLPCLLWLTLSSSAIAQLDVIVACAVTKKHDLIQTNSGPPVAYTQTPFSFSALFQPKQLINANTATVTPPGGEAESLDDSLVPEFNILVTPLALFSTQAGLNNTYPSGWYTNSIDVVFPLSGASEHVDISVPLVGDLYPNDPRIVNFNEAQAINPNQDFAVRFDPFQGVTELDQIGIVISKAIGLKEELIFNALSANSFVSHIDIPANTLQANTEYTARIIFDRWTANHITNVTNGTILGPLPVKVIARSSYSKTTRFQISTRIPEEGPFLQITSPAGSPLFRFQFPSTVGRQYRIQITDDFVGWTTLSTTNATASQVSFQQILASTNKARFFRVVSP